MNRKVKNIVVINSILSLIIAIIIFFSILMNLREFYIFILYISISLILFVTIYLIKKIITNKEIKEYYRKAQQLMLYSTILFLSGLIFMLTDLIYLTYPLVILGSLIFSIGFLKITMIGKLLNKNKMIKDKKYNKEKNKNHKKK